MAGGGGPGVLEEGGWVAGVWLLAHLGPGPSPGCLLLAGSCPLTAKALVLGTPLLSALCFLWFLSPSA